MPIVIQCPECQKRLKVPEKLIGKTIKCPACMAMISVQPVDSEAAAPPPAPEEHFQITPKPAPQATENFQHARCPNCNSRLKLLRKLIGKEIKCPECGEDFVAEAEVAPREEGIWLDPKPKPKKPLARPRDDDDDDDEDEKPRRRRKYDDDDDDDDESWRRPIRRSRADASGALTVPAICLLVTGILGVLINEFQAIVAIADPRILQNNQFGQDTPPWASTLAGVIFTLVSLVTVGGAFAMMKKSMYGLCMTGAILAMINIGNCCCILGLPFGIWALVVLARPEVKDSF